MSSVNLQDFQGKIVDHAGAVVDLKDITSKRFIGLYFSAHWCPPCRGFTPVLAQFYNDVQASDPSALEIIFLSSDQNDESFQSYFKDMPWKALAFGDALKGSLGSQFGVTGIPCFVVVDQNGKFLTKDGRGHVQQLGPEGAIKQWATL